MSKKAVIILSVLAIALAGASGALWYTVNGKLARASTSFDKLTGFSGTTFEAKLAAPAKAMAKLAEVSADAEQKAATIASNETKISGLERKLKDSEASVEELNSRNSDLIRARDDLKRTSDDFQSKASQAESRVKDLEADLVKQNEAAAQEKEELNTKVEAEKTTLLAEVEKTRQHYSQLYNFSSGKLPQVPFPPRPWDQTSAGKEGAPRFASKIFVAEVVGYDARQGIVVLNVGSEAGLPRNQSFNLQVGDNAVAKVTIVDIINAALSTASVATGETVPALPVGTVVKLVPVEVAAPAPVAAK